MLDDDDVAVAVKGADVMMLAIVFSKFDGFLNEDLRLALDDDDDVPLLLTDSFSAAAALH